MISKALFLVYVFAYLVFTLLNSFVAPSWSSNATFGMFLAFLFWVLSIASFVVALYLGEISHVLGRYIAVSLVRWKNVESLKRTLSKVSPKLWLQSARQKAVEQSLVSFYPVRPTVRSGRIVYLAGPIFCLVVFGLSFYCLNMISSDWSSLRWQDVLSTLLKLASLNLLFAGLASLFSGKAWSDQWTDGCYVDWSFGEPEKFLLWLDCWELYSLSQEGRPRDFPVDLLEPRKEDPGYRAVNHLVRYWAALDAGNIDSALTEIESAWNLIHELSPFGQFQAPIAFETSMFFARFVDDRKLSDIAYGFGLSANKDCFARVTADTARLYAEGRIDEAKEIADRETKKLDDQPTTPDHQREHARDWYARILDPDVPSLPRPLTP